MSSSTASVLLVGAAGILLGIWWLRRQENVGPPLAGGQLSYSYWNQVPYANLPGPPSTWALINR